MLTTMSSVVSTEPTLPPVSTCDSASSCAIWSAVILSLPAFASRVSAARTVSPPLFENPAGLGFFSLCGPAACAPYAWSDADGLCASPAPPATAGLGPFDEKEASCDDEPPEADSPPWCSCAFEVVWVCGAGARPGSPAMPYRTRDPHASFLKAVPFWHVGAVDPPRGDRGRMQER